MPFAGVRRVAERLQIDRYARGGERCCCSAGFDRQTSTTSRAPAGSSAFDFPEKQRPPPASCIDQALKNHKNVLSLDVELRIDRMLVEAVRGKASLNFAGGERLSRQLKALRRV
jgi:hypothetical protein